MTCISSCIYVTHTIYIYTYIHNNIYIKREREHMMLCYVMFQEIWHHDSSFSSLHRKNDEDRLQRRRIEAETRCAPWNGRGWSKISQEIPGGRGNKSGKPQFWKFFFPPNPLIFSPWSTSPKGSQISWKVSWGRLSFGCIDHPWPLRKHPRVSNFDSLKP